MSHTAATKSRRLMRPALTGSLIVASALLPAACGSSSSSSESKSEAKVTTSSGMHMSSSATAKSSGGGSLAGSFTAHELKIEADPGGALRYVQSKAEAAAGPVKIVFSNNSGMPHNFHLSGNGIDAKTPIESSGSATLSLNLKAGSYSYYCDVPGHREAGMEGKLTVR